MDPTDDDLQAHNGKWMNSAQFFGMTREAFRVISF